MQQLSISSVLSTQFVINLLLATSFDKPMPIYSSSQLAHDLFLICVNPLLQTVTGNVIYVRLLYLLPTRFALLFCFFLCVLNFLWFGNLAPSTQRWTFALAKHLLYKACATSSGNPVEVKVLESCFILGTSGNLFGRQGHAVTTISLISLFITFGYIFNST